MNREVGPEYDSRLDQDLYQEMAAQTAYYSTFENPQEVLQQGLGDEVTEMLEQACGDGFWTEDKNVPEYPLPLEDLRGELGDLLWYVSQLFKIRNVRLSSLITQDQWSGIIIPESTQYVDVAKPDSNAKYPLTHVSYDFATEPIICLGLQMTELIDAKYTESDENVNRALGSMLRGISLVANLRGLTLDEVAAANISKLAQRSRKPHTIEHIEDSLPSLSRQKFGLWVSSQINKEV